MMSEKEVDALIVNRLEAYWPMYEKSRNNPSLQGDKRDVLEEAYFITQASNVTKPEYTLPLADYYVSERLRARNRVTKRPAIFVYTERVMFFFTLITLYLLFISNDVAVQPKCPKDLHAAEETEIYHAD